VSVINAVQLKQAEQLNKEIERVRADLALVEAIEKRAGV